MVRSAATWGAWTQAELKLFLHEMKSPHLEDGNLLFWLMGQHSQRTVLTAHFLQIYLRLFVLVKKDKSQQWVRKEALYHLKDSKRQYS